MRRPLRSWSNTLQSMGFRKRKHANERPAKRFAFEPLEERRVLSGLSPVLSTDPAAAQKFWSEQLATGSPLLSGPVTNFAPPGARPNNAAALESLAQSALASPPTPPAGVSGAELLAAALSQVDLAHAATFNLTGGEMAASWSQPLGPQPLASPSTGEGARVPSLDLRQLPAPTTYVIQEVDNVNDGVANVDILVC